MPLFGETSSTTPFFEALSASVPWDPTSIGAGAHRSLEVPLEGADFGMAAAASFTSITVPGWRLSAAVIAPGMVSALLSNYTGAAANLPEGTLTVICFRS